MKELEERHNILSAYDSDLPRRRRCRSLHAEIDALLKADTESDTVVVARFRADGSLGCSKPCNYCMAFMKEKNVKTCFYSTKNQTFKRLEI